MNVSQQIINALRQRGLPEIGDAAEIIIAPIIQDTIAAAVQAEREACEKIADGYDMPCEPRTESEDTAHSIKIAIMRRGEVTE